MYYRGRTLSLRCFTSYSMPAEECETFSSLGRTKLKNVDVALSFFFTLSLDLRSWLRPASAKCLLHPLPC